jgi:hypothetical protein
MNAGIEILIQRLKDCPEDFVEGKWARLLSMALVSSDFTSEEKDALSEVLRNKNRDSFTERVMKTLAGEDEPSDEGKWLTKERIMNPNAMGTGGQTLAPSLAVPNGGTGATWGVTTTNTTNPYRFTSFNDDQDVFEKAIKLDMSVEEYVRTRGL